MEAKNRVVLFFSSGQISFRFTHIIPEENETIQETIKVHDINKVFKAKPGSRKDLWEMVLKKLIQSVKDKGEFKKAVVLKINRISKRLPPKSRRSRKK